MALQVITNPNQGLNLQSGNVNLQGPSVNTLQSAVANPTINQSATTPKQKYIQQQTASSSPVADNNITANQASNSAYFNANPGAFGGSTNQPTQTSPTAPVIPTNPATNFNGTSGGNGTGIYDPYNSPAYQNYLNTYIESQKPALSTSQINQGQIDTTNTLANIQKTIANQTANAQGNPALSNNSLTGQSMAAAKQGSLETAAVQPLLDLYKQQQQQAGVGPGAALNSANTEAGYLAGIAKPTAIGTGQSLVLPNPATGQAQTLTGLPSFAAGTNTQTGAPYTYNQQTGAINNGGTGLGTTPPSLSGDVVSPNDPYYQTLQTYAGLLASNQGSAVPLGSLPPAVQAQVLRMAQGQGYNANTSAALAASQQTQVQQQQTYKSALQQGQNLQSQLTDLIKTFGLNPNDLNAANSVIQTIAKNTSDSRYQVLQNYINDVANTYAQVLTPTSGSQTDTTRSIAASMLNQTASGTSIQDVMKALDNAAQAKIAGVVTAGGGNTGSSSSLFSW